MRILIKNASIFLNKELKKRDILIEKGKIKSIEKNLKITSNSLNKVINIQDNFVSPGFVDVHVHLRDPGFTQKETILTGSLAAAHGGFTTIAAMPNVIPVPDTPPKIRKMIQRNKKEGKVHIFQYATITKGRDDSQLVDFKAAKQAGAFAVSNDGSGIQKSNVMYQAMKMTAKNHIPLVNHAEDSSLTFGGVVNQGLIARKLNLPGIPDVSESTQIARDLLLAQATGAHYHVCHVSCASSVNMIRIAKKIGINVTCEVTPHHLLLDETSIHKDDSMLKMNPPLRSPKDREALIKGLKDGTIDIIATDHAPHTKKDKAGSMKKAAFGITGLETAFSVLYTGLVKTKKLKLNKLIELMTLNPAVIFGFYRAGQLKIGQPADLTIINLKKSFQIKKENMLSKGKNSPFIGKKVYGEILATLVNGKIVYRK